jgi:hypothetical protein
MCFSANEKSWVGSSFAVLIFDGTESVGPVQAVISTEWSKRKLFGC